MAIILVDSYAVGNQDDTQDIYSTEKGVGFSFTGKHCILDSIRLYLKKFQLPTGTAYVKIYAHSGTFGNETGSGSVPTGDALAISDSFDISTLTTSLGFYTFDFASINRITLSDGINYVFTIESADISNGYLMIGLDGSTPTHPGNISHSADTITWLANLGKHDLIFDIYGEKPVVGPFPTFIR